MCVVLTNWAVQLRAQHCLQFPAVWSEEVPEVFCIIWVTVALFFCCLLKIKSILKFVFNFGSFILAFSFSNLVLSAGGSLLSKPPGDALWEIGIHDSKSRLLSGFSVLLKILKMNIINIFLITMYQMTIWKGLLVWTYRELSPETAALLDFYRAFIVFSLFICPGTT